MAIATAAVVTGKPYKEAQYLVDQAWPKLAQLKPNVLKLYDTDDAPLQVAQGEGVMGGPEYSKYVYPYQVKGAPIDMCFPKEGAFAGVNCQVFVKGGPNADLGAAFMNRVLEPKIQQGLAEATIAAPSVDGIEFKPEIAKMLALSGEEDGRARPVLARLGLRQQGAPGLDREDEPDLRLVRQR